MVLALAISLSLIWTRPFRRYPDSEKFLIITRGTSSYEVAHQLQREGVIRHWSLFLIYLKTVKWNAHVQAGEYRFDSPLPIVQVADKLIRGLIFYHEFTIPEGYSIFDIGALLEQKGFSPAEVFWKAASRTQRVSQFANPSQNLEGFLFPDTYRFARGTTAEEIVGIMVSRFTEVYTDWLKPQLEHSPLRLEEVLTLASLIEKETSVDAERELVSAVLHNRLKKRMPLQCDPTVIYAARLAGTYQGTILQSNLDFDSAYNTYRRLGLPPGPIANPGRRSIEAAIHPAPVDYLYFVANNGGGHVFSKTLEAHQRAVAAYRKRLNSGTKPAPLAPTANKGQALPKSQPQN
jgi:UPF0755 protein